MRRRLTILLICFSFVAHAQVDFQTHSELTYIYQISDEVAYGFYEEGFEPTEAHMRGLVDSFPINKHYQKPLLGNYLFASVKQERILISLNCYNSIIGRVIDNKRDFILEVFDSLGLEIENAQVDLDGKVIPFDLKANAYQLKNCKKGGLLRIQANNEVLVYDLTRKKVRNTLSKRLNNFKRTKFGYFLNTPARLVSKPYRYFKRGFKKGNWQVYQKWMPLRRCYRRIFKSKIPNKGYIVTNKPKYLPGDTVKVKAYVTKKNGKPVKKDLRFKFALSWKRKYYINETISPNTPGNFTYQFVLGDSLTLDKSYSVEFQDLRERRGTISRKFKYEDYQLDDLTWNFSSQKKVFEINDPVILKGEGKTANGLTVPDGEIALLLLTKNISDFHEDEIYIPDTLWQHKQVLRTRGETVIIVPDSIFPPVNMQLEAQALFQNSNGEIQKKTITFKARKQKNYIDVEIKNGHFSADYKENGRSKPFANAILDIHGIGPKTPIRDTVDLPYKMKLNHTFNRYRIDAGNTKKIVFIHKQNYRSKTYPSAVVVSGYHVKDSVFVNFSNPNLTSIYYQIYKGRALVEEGVTKNAGFLWAEKDKSKSNYEIRFNYMWGGQMTEGAYPFTYFKNKLAIEVDQVSKVSPGGSTPVKIQVTKQNGKVAKHVNLTAGAINSKFKDSKNYDTPSITYAKSKKIKNKCSYKITKPRNSLARPKIDTTTYLRYGLDSLFYYQVRFENEGLVLRYDTVVGDSFYQDIAQVGPHLIKDGLTQPIYMIYLNNKLVYYYGVDDNPRYSFIGREGMNRLVIRTKDYEYSLDVILKNGHKLELVLNENNYTKIKRAHRVQRKAMPKVLTYHEIGLLHKSIFSLNNTSTNLKVKYIWQGNQIHVLDKFTNYGATKVGPFTPGLSLRYLEQDGFMHTFKYDLGYTYELSPAKEKLVKNDFFDVKKEYPLMTIYNEKPLGQIVYAPTQIIAKRATETALTFIKNYSPKFKNTGRLKIDAEWKKDSIIAVVLTINNDSLKYVYPSKSNDYGHLEEGEWTVYLLRKSGAYYETETLIKPNGLRYLNLKAVLFINNSTKSILNNYISEPVKKLEEVLSFEEFDFLKKGKTGIMGRIEQDADSISVADIKITVLSDGIQVAQTLTNREGYYHLELLEGRYDLEINGGKDRLKTIKGVYIKGKSSTVLDFILTESYGIDLVEIIIFGYRIPLIEQDKTSTGLTLTSEDISKIPSRSVAAIVATTAGVTSDNIVNIRGSRTNATEYFIDGVRLEGYASSSILKTEGTLKGKVVDQETKEEQIGANVSVYQDGKIITGTTTDFNGNYTLNAPEGVYKLEVSYVGYIDVVIEGVRIYGKQNNIFDVELVEGVRLQTAVVTGFGSRPRSSKQQLNLESNNDNASLPAGVQLRSNFQDYAYWQPNLVTDKNGEAYFEATYPDNITSWNTYVIGMDRKKRAGLATQNVKAYKDLIAELAIPRFLIAGDKADIIGKAINFTNKTYDIETEFLLNGTESIQQNEAKVTDALIERARVEAPFEQDSLTMTYQVRAGAYGDGEERSIPIFPQGVEETLGGFYVLEGDTTLTVPVNETYGETNIYIQNNIIEALLSDLKYLHDYPYSCNEQTASRLLGLLLQKEVNEKLGVAFNEAQEKAIGKSIAQLKKTQNLDGSWGWWDGGEANVWMTTHVLRALHQANQDGYATTPLTDGWRYLTSNLHLFPNNALLKSLELLSDIGQNMDYELFLAKLDTLDLNEHQRFITYKIRQANDLPYSLDSLTQSRKETVFGSYYWGSQRYNWGNNRNQNTLLAYGIYKNAGDEAAAKKILNYLMESRSRRTSHGCRIGRNTYEISKVLNVVLPDLLVDVDSLSDLQTSVVLESGFRDTLTQFPYQNSFTSTKDLKITKEGKGAVYLTTYQQFHNPKPKAKDDLFEVTSTLSQKGKETKDLEQGEKATLKVTVEVKKSADYIMIEIPIPAGCSYYSKPQKWGYPTVHREYFKEKTAIFCQSLDVGTYTYEVELEPRYNGTYTLNPTKVEQMYFPVFYGRNEMKQVEIGEK